MVSYRWLISAMIDSRDFLATKPRAETTVRMPTGRRIVVTGSLDFHDHRPIWDKLDRPTPSTPRLCCYAPETERLRYDRRTLTSN